MKKYIILLVVIIIILAFGIYYVNRNGGEENTANNNQNTTQDESGDEETNEENKPEDTKNAPEVVIGKSVEGRDITAYRYGTGEKEILFVGGIHGGYEWNTSLVAFQLMDYLKENPTVVPEDVKVTVIPVVNPDGLNKVVGTSGRFTSADVSANQTVVVSGRFNANNVDLNRNFDCGWQANAVWQNKAVSGGTSAFSEPESVAVKNYVEMNKPTAAVVWYSAAGGVYASNCYNGIPAETKTIGKTFATASGYPYYENFNFYAITGDMVNWLAKNNIPAISVLLTNHTDTEWSKNKAGVDALLKYYSK